MKKIVLAALGLLIPASCPAGTLLWDSLTVTIQESNGNPAGAIVDIVNLHWTSETPVPTLAQLQDNEYMQILYSFSGVQQSSDGTVVPNEQAFFTFDPVQAAQIMDSYMSNNLYVGLYSGATFVDGAFTSPTNSSISIQAVPEPVLVVPVALALAALLIQRRKKTSLRRA